MPSSASTKKKIVSIEEQIARGAKGEKWSAERYPISLLEPYLTRRRRRQTWVNAEVKQLQFTFANMPDIA